MREFIQILADRDCWVSEVKLTKEGVPVWVKSLVKRERYDLIARLELPNGDSVFSSELRDYKHKLVTVASGAYRTVYKVVRNYTWLGRVKFIHPELDFSRSNYVNNKAKVLVWCNDHGTYETTPQTLLAGSGCAQCGGNRMSTENFIQRAKLKHNGKYGYGKTEVVKPSREVIITCKEHGDFEQKPNQHLRGHGCRPCSYITGEETKRVSRDRRNNLNEGRVI